MRRGLLLPLALAAALPAAAQEGPDPDSLLLAGVLENGPVVSESDVMGRCLELAGGWTDPDLRPRTEGLPTWCEPAESGELERAGDRRFFWARYSHTTVLPDNADAPADTLREEEVVLFSAPLEGGRLTAEWHARYDLDYWTGIHLASAPTEDDGALVSVLACVNGTGGCRQQFLLRGRGGWNAVRQAWAEQLPDSAGGEFWKGSFINPATLQGEASLYAEDDANCCPSRILYVRVRLRDGALVLRDFRTVATGEP